MDQNKQLIKRISAISLIVFGIILGGTWRKEGICLGDYLFSMIGLPVWSEGTEGMHYPAMAGLIFILIGIGMLNTALSKKQRIWVWSMILLLLVLINFLSGCTGIENGIATYSSEKGEESLQHILKHSGLTAAEMEFDGY